MQRGIIVRFLVSALVGVVIAVGIGIATAGPGFGSTADNDPPMSLTGTDGAPLDFVLAKGNPKPIEPLPPTTTLQLTAFHADGASPGPDGLPQDPWWNESTPRIKPISQFDGGPLQKVNCLPAVGAMLARLGFGIVTTGSQVRAIMGDTEGATNYFQLMDTVQKGWGVRFLSGRLTPLQLRAVLYAGAGAVIDGVYGEIPVKYRVQKNFTGRHAIYVDAFRPDGPDGQFAAYYVIDPIGRPERGYRGGWWPAADVERMTAQLAGGRIDTMWAFPGGQVPANRPILPPSYYPTDEPVPSPPPTPTTGPGGTPDASAGASPGESPGETPGSTAAPDPYPTDPEPVDGGTDLGEDTGGDPVDFGVRDFFTDVFEVKEASSDGCALQGSRLGCPQGIRGIVDIGGFPKPSALPPRGIEILYADPIGLGMYQIVIEPPPDTRPELWWWSNAGEALKAATVQAATLNDGTRVGVAIVELDPTASFSFIATASGNGIKTYSSVGTLEVKP